MTAGLAVGPGPVREPATAGGQIRVERVMGTVIGIDVRSEVPLGALDDAFAYLHDVDARFSPFRPDSEIERLARGELSMADASDELLAVTALCHELRLETEGAFDAWGHRADGSFDPTGVVKGWALDGAAGILRAAGAISFAVNGGGDVVVAGEAAPGRPWRVGIRHPLRPDRTAAVLELVDMAVATSGAYERGAHIVDPGTGQPAAGLMSVTVAAPSLARADAFATAVFAMGMAGPRWFAGRGGALLAITTDQQVLTTPAMDRLLAARA
jgi:thiamine biosynthesis lipoprotein